MQIVSYRGPSQAGGVSNLINQAIEHDRQSTWWFIDQSQLHCISRENDDTRASLPQSIVEGHYRFCNEYLWPLMHNREDLAYFNENDHNCYTSLNVTLAAHLNWEAAHQALYIHDYQFAVMPSFLSEKRWSSCLFFWHIPWPTSVSKDAAVHLKEIARGLLRCARVGFHTEKYIKNFCTFVHDFIPEFVVASDGSRIVHKSGHSTELVVSPAGVDYFFWNQAAKYSTPQLKTSCPYILSVDRADYTKGIAERISAIEYLFDTRPDFIGKLQFVFVCQPTRTGLSAFENYWTDCRNSYAGVFERFSTDDWSPILWLPHSMNSYELAALYTGATAMLVNPSADGLNLTAKEFIASAIDLNTVLILSSGAGAWQELSDFVVSVESCRPMEIAAAVVEALAMPLTRRRANMLAMKRLVRANTLENWWYQMTNGVVNVFHADVDCA